MVQLKFILKGKKTLQQLLVDEFNLSAVNGGDGDDGDSANFSLNGFLDAIKHVA